MTQLFIQLNSFCSRRRSLLFHNPDSLAFVPYTHIDREE